MSCGILDQIHDARSADRIFYAFSARAGMLRGGRRLRIDRAAGEAAGGSLRLAGAQSLTVPVLAPVIRKWHRRYPEVTISLRESAVADQLLGFIDCDEADMVLMPLRVPGSEGDDR